MLRCTSGLRTALTKAGADHVGFEAGEAGEGLFAGGSDGSRR
ncbi:hypothetical protein [Phycisphaera mikurensis]|uniref:Uncharacterized protein n=1 Tax=Phycisphaera mikurensis (strain NBRC 102666 / KCTC 22515 / FYK2301M01) TaxID=1142394 RepID=I0IAN5_PHYMF|nr:hypothetical protein [Phycisphaera mikurensis]MBB6441682.1 hypothetical protein [Phycisphaera mikurensis]BAM02323.1 hypothetical protein PSMK_01640 [Phycisphaera mikurensis NBRC 102666]